MKLNKTLFWVFSIGTLIIVAYLIAINALNSYAEIYLIVSCASLIFLYGITIFQVNREIRFSEKTIHIPKIYGKLSIQVDQIKGLRAKKTILGNVLEFSALTIDLKNGDTESILVYDTIIEQLKRQEKKLIDAKFNNLN